MSKPSVVVKEFVAMYIEQTFMAIEESQSLSLDNEADRKQLKLNIMDRLEKLTNERTD